MSDVTAFAGKDGLVAGANRGVGQALVEEALRRGARRVCAGPREPFAHSDERVTPLILNVTDAAQTQQAVQAVPWLDVLVNNAGVALYDDLSDRAILEQHLTIDLFGLHDVMQALLPLLVRSRGVIINNLDAAAPLPVIPISSIAKAAAYSLTQAQRTLLTSQDVTVHAMLTGPGRHRRDSRVRRPDGIPGIVRASRFRRRAEPGEGHLPPRHGAGPGHRVQSSPAKALKRALATMATTKHAKS
ncbi:NAD(P)-dependent dehydrogenase (short-subunit alcohol dehydrogenase family) [Nonomuraea fuscirosea]|uniref:NAD(P)-dependent dehydrogenase (Short-subunit alcohol dehydrogenase family) n=1 Tax=Nonomuraea fuscirosea TaxID=1291556 RepID=A0A2T0M1U3_9ACTN|nr:SDR family NAD(P)-dependent oxidoreductase [Nonomuraea fuscirosea]PRX50718.1 NAD(P)-dependent dehydrogenase (short-subunit alcohol dehydrogenase family) [Nonomuraea fuscirosea]